MDNNRVDEFLEQYKRLEQLLKQFYGNDSGRFESVVARYENSRDCGNMRENIRAVREIRNLLQHNTKINGNYIVEPSEEIMKALKDVIYQVEHPKLAIDFGIPDKNIYKATLSSSLMKVITVMKERGFSHVPVFDNGKLYGVLSVYSVFEFLTEQEMQIITEDTMVMDMTAYLPIAKHKNEAYLFLPKTATFIEADEAFEKRDNRGRRVVAIFITETGRSDERILAMLIPWSVLGK